MADLENLFFPNKKKDKKEKLNKILDALYETPKKDKGNNMPRFAQIEPGIIQQADLLFMPADGEYKYILVVVDQGNRFTDAEPLTGKTNAEVLEAFKTIYHREILKLPKRIEVDAGSEFKGPVAKWFADKRISVRAANPGRHRQQALVERRNQIIAKALFRRMAAQELLTDETSKEWVEDLPKLIKIMNDRAKKMKKPKLTGEPILIGNAKELLSPGTKVRVIMEQPRDPITNKVLPGKFRSTDLRWNPKVRIIKDMLIKPDSPPLYLLDGDVGKRKVEPVAYTKNQLQVIPENEQYPTKEVIRGKPSKYVVDKILGKKKIKGKIFYKIKWRGFSEADATFEPRTELIKDIPQVIKDYEK